jgi:hypothetical protein
MTVPQVTEFASEIDDDPILAYSARRNKLDYGSAPGERTHVDRI